MNRESRRVKRGHGVLGWVVAAGALATLGGDCDGDIVKDPTFRDWCGSGLCSWSLDAGQMQRVPTWDENDLGVAFTASPTQITQVTNEGQAKCILFTTTADIDPAAQMSLLVDFNNDGTIDSRQPLGSTQWHRLRFELTAPRSYKGVTFHVRKEGTGTAVLAELRIQSTSDCSGPPVRSRRCSSASLVSGTT